MRVHPPTGPRCACLCGCWERATPGLVLHEAFSLSWIDLAVCQACYDEAQETMGALL